METALGSRVSVEIFGAVGTAAATKELEAGEAVPVPIAFTAATVQV